jgi:hypothetical protein
MFRHEAIEDRSEVGWAELNTSGEEAMDGSAHGAPPATA